MGSGDHQKCGGETAAVDPVVNCLKSVQALLTNVTSYPLQGLDLVQHQDETCVARNRAAPREDLAGNSMLRKWSMSPFTPADRLTLALTFGWPASQASRPSAIAVSFDARRTGRRAESPA